MPFHIKRSTTTSMDAMTVFNGARTSTWPTPAPGHSILEKQHFPDPQALKDVPDGDNPLIPPMHWHWYQEEYFTVTAGRFIFTLEGQDTLISSSDPQPVTIPVLARHTFKVDASCTEPCSIEIATPSSPAGDDDGLSERFFRNLYSYLEDCGRQGREPSLPQLLLFLDSAEVSVALPGPGWLARPLGYALGVVLGRWVGGYVLGYRASYPEYWDDARGKKAR